MRDRLWSHRFIAKYTNEILRALDELVLVGDERLVKFGIKNFFMSGGHTELADAVSDYNLLIKTLA